MSQVRSDAVLPIRGDVDSLVSAVDTLGRFSVEQDTRPVTAAYAMGTLDDLVLANGVFTVMLPKVVDAQRKRYIVKNTGVGVVTVNGNGVNIDGAATLALAAFEVADLLQDGSQWWRL